MSSQSQMHAVTTPNKILTDAEKLRKVILELIETERTYVKVIIMVTLPLQSFQLPWQVMGSVYDFFFLLSYI